MLHRGGQQDEGSGVAAVCLKEARHPLRLVNAHHARRLGALCTELLEGGIPDPGHERRESIEVHRGVPLEDSIRGGLLTVDDVLVRGELGELPAANLAPPEDVEAVEKFLRVGCHPIRIKVRVIGGRKIPSSDLPGCVQGGFVGKGAMRQRL